MWSLLDITGRIQEQWIYRNSLFFAWHREEALFRVVLKPCHRVDRPKQWTALHILLSKFRLPRGFHCRHQKWTNAPQRPPSKVALLPPGTPLPCASAQFPHDSQDALHIPNVLLQKSIYLYVISQIPYVFLKNYFGGERQTLVCFQELPIKTGGTLATVHHSYVTLAVEAFNLIKNENTVKA